MRCEEKEGVILEEMPLVDKETYFFELTRFCNQLHVLALGLEGFAMGGPVIAIDCEPDRHMRVLCQSAWCLVQKAGGLARVYWTTVGQPTPGTLRQVTQGGV